MASKNSIPSYNEDQQLESLRPGTGLTDDVVDPAAQDTMYTGIPQQIAEANAKAGVAYTPKPNWSKGGK